MSQIVIDRYLELEWGYRVICRQSESSEVPVFSIRMMQPIILEIKQLYLVYLPSRCDWGRGLSCQHMTTFCSWKFDAINLMQYILCNLCLIWRVIGTALLYTSSLMPKDMQQWMTSFNNRNQVDCDLVDQSLETKQPGKRSFLLRLRHNRSTISEAQYDDWSTNPFNK